MRIGCATVTTNHQIRNVALLSMCQGIFVCGQTSLILLGGFVGFMLASDKSLATLPVSAVILGTAAMTVPASLLMRRVGRRIGFMAGALIGIAGLLICIGAVLTENFWLLVVGSFVVGFYNAFCQYYRFAVADASEPQFRPKAISLVLAGGVLAGLIGPAIATYSRNLIPDFDYLGSYVALVGVTVVAVVLLNYIRIPALSAEQQRDSGRPLQEIMVQPRFIAAVMSSMIAYGVMSLLMTATPLAMVGCGFEAVDAGQVIQWHVLGMFGPSFFTGHLIARFGLYNVMVTGALLLAACVGISLSGLEFVNFSVALLLLGIGWNFLFVGATTMITELHTAAERAKTQAANDLLVFGATAVSSFLSGALLHKYGWATVNVVAIPFIAVALVLTVMLGIHSLRTSRRA